MIFLFVEGFDNEYFSLLFGGNARTSEEDNQYNIYLYA